MVKLIYDGVDSLRETFGLAVKEAYIALRRAERVREVHPYLLAHTERILMERALNSSLFPSPSPYVALEIISEARIGLLQENIYTKRPVSEIIWAADELTFLTASSPTIFDKTPLGRSGVISAAASGYEVVSSNKNTVYKDIAKLASRNHKDVIVLMTTILNVFALMSSRIAGNRLDTNLLLDDLSIVSTVVNVLSPGVVPLLTNTAMDPTSSGRGN